MCRNVPSVGADLQPANWVVLLLLEAAVELQVCRSDSLMHLVVTVELLLRVEWLKRGQGGQTWNVSKSSSYESASSLSTTFYCERNG